MKSMRVLLAFSLVFSVFSGLAVASEDDGFYTAIRLGYFPYTAEAEGTIGGRDFDTEVDLSDLMDNTETLLGGEIEIGKGRFFLNLAGFFQEVETDRGNESNGATIIASETALNPMLGYRLYQQGLKAFAVMAGAYYVKLDLDAEIYSNILGNASLERDLTFTDPMLGVRGYYGFTPKIGVAGSGQVGGFGVGSELHYQLMANLVYRFNQTFSASAGWRHWYWDYEDSSAFVSDLEQTLSGPTVGLEIRFK